jgi:predicted membrane-bound spermidine synthase
MKFIDSDLQDYTGKNFSVLKNSNGITEMIFSNGVSLYNKSNYVHIMLGQCTDCDYLYKGFFEGFTYDKVLIAGLGFGLIPQTLSEVNNCSKIDVVEIDQEIIDYNNSSGHLNSDIVIIKSDIFEYITNEKYDLIIIDTIWDENGMSEEQVQTLSSKFLATNLNIGGALYIPIKNKWLINK